MNYFQLFTHLVTVTGLEPPTILSVNEHSASQSRLAWLGQVIGSRLKVNSWILRQLH